jgi:SAM-dependent methyltransferase
MSVYARQDKKAIIYLRGASLGEYLERTRLRHPMLAAILDFDRPGSFEALSALSVTRTEFDSDQAGRGDTYRTAQTDVSVRWTGMRQLLSLCVPDRSRGHLVLDVLGGNGTVARALQERGETSAKDVCVLTGDLSAEMVEHALDDGLAAIRQSADFLFLKEASVDSVLLAYGTHHIPPKCRPLAVAEALRALRPGGRIVLHDFSEASPTARFFHQVVHSYFKAGHDYEHFSRESLTGLFQTAGLRVSITELYDPLLVRGRDADEARRKICDYIINMYGVGSWISPQADLDDAWRQLTRYFDHSGHMVPSMTRGKAPVVPVVQRDRAGFVAVIPRVALVAVAQKAK